MGQRTSLALLLGAALAAGCTSAGFLGDLDGGGGGAGPVALYDPSPSRADFFAAPWPSDARRKGSGAAATFDLGGFHDPGPGIIQNLIKLVGSEPLGGFGTASAIFFRFDGALDPASLPADAAASIAAGASAFVVDVTPGSPTVGKRAPLHVAYRAMGGNYLGDNALVLLPAPGFPLRPKTTYAAIVTDGVRGPGGAARRDSRFTLPTFPSSPGVDGARIVSATVFTTSDPVSGMKALRDATYAKGPVPAIDAGTLQYEGSQAGFDRYQGTFASPNFQQGSPPYLTTGGGITFDAQGAPQIARVEHLRFMVTVPTGATPGGGWPVVLYAHGTGGDYGSFVNDGSAASAAVQGLAMISIDQPNHGPRDPSGANPELTVYNIQNFTSSRDIFRQGAADDFQLLRLVKAIAVGAAPGTGKPLRFDAAKILFKGHSQGGATGPLFLAYEPEVRAAVLSGAGANLMLSLLAKTQPVNIPALLDGIIGEPVDEYHPLLSLVQTYLEPADPGNYARLFFREPPGGQAPKSIYQSLGIVDHYTPVPTIKALALAMGVQPVNPMLTPLDDLAVAGLTWAGAPVAGNVAGGKATGVLCQYTASGSSDGHFVVFEVVDAVRQSNAFLGSAAKAGGAPTLAP